MPQNLFFKKKKKRQKHIVSLTGFFFLRKYNIIKKKLLLRVSSSLLSLFLQINNYLDKKKRATVDTERHIRPWRLKLKLPHKNKKNEKRGKKILVFFYFTFQKKKKNYIHTMFAYIQVQYSCKRAFNSHFIQLCLIKFSHCTLNLMPSI